MLKVEQGDREAAATYLAAIPGFDPTTVESFRSGGFDHLSDALPQAFAKHREDTALPLREAILKARKQFAYYVDQHLAKSPPDTNKAAINQCFVEIMDAALHSDTTGGE